MARFRVLWSKKLQAFAVVVIVLGLVKPVLAEAAIQPRDANTNAIMYNGAYTKAEWLTKVRNGDGVNTAENLQKIYFDEGRGITEANFMSSDTVDGTVFQDGHVEVAGKTVATNMYSIGRHDLPGRTPSGSVYESPNQEAFIAKSLPAFINMQGGTFHYAIIKSCGNAGRATPVPKATPTPTPTPKPSPTSTPKPSPTPVQSFKCTKLLATQPDKQHSPETFRFTIFSDVENVKLAGYRFGVHEEGSENAVDIRDIDVSKNYTDYTLGEGTWEITGQVKTSAGITAVSAACTAQVVSLRATPTPSPTPSGSGEVLGATLPATGSGAVLGGAIGLTAIGYTMRGYLSSRKSVLETLRTVGSPKHK